MWPWKSAKPPDLAPRRDRGSEGQLDASTLISEVNRLETRIERLELDHSERQVAVLSALEKVMSQLRARERKRQRTAEGEEEAEPEETPARTVDAIGRRVDGKPYDMAARAYHRFRRF